MEPLRVALAQADIVLGNPEANRSRLPEWAARAAGVGAQLLLLPELWDVGYAHACWPTVGAPLRGGACDALAQVAQRFHLFIAASVLERHEEGLSNTAVVVSPQGDLVGSYRKVHLIPLFQEDKYFQPGLTPAFVELPWGRMGLAVCYDLRFPELFRAYAVGGAVAVLLVAEWPHERIEHWRALIRARAIENQFFMMACNRVGRDAAVGFGGHSMAVGPRGEVLVEGNGAEALLAADVDLSQVHLARSEVPALAGRRPDLYAQW
ncbi:MAG: carbon-nitrogen family hydrolase [Anaerolineae bacterium]